MDSHGRQQRDTQTVPDRIDEVLHVLDLAGDPPGEAGCRAGGVDLGPQGRVSAIVDEIPISERRVAEPDRRPAGQRITAAHGEDELIAAQLDAGEPGPVHRAVDEGNVEFRIGCGARQSGGGVMTQPDGDTWMRTAKAGQQCGQVHDAQCLDSAHLQPAVQHPADAGDGLTALVGCGKRSACGRQQRPSGLGQRHPTVIADEECLAQFALQRADGRAQAGLHHVHASRRAGEVQLFGNRNEVRELA